MPMTLNLPRDFRPAAEALRAHPKDPLAQEFLGQLRLDARWSPRLPRGLLWVARRHGSPMHDIDFLEVTLTGFRSRRLRHVGATLLRIARARRKRGEYIYDDGRDLLIIGGDDAPQPFGTPDWFRWPQNLGSALDIAKPPLVLPSEPAAPSSPTRAPAPGFITR